MNHLILFISCLVSVEILIRSNYISLVNLTIKVSKKAIHTISNKNISDHWKENIIPIYSFQMMKYSLQMLIIIFLIISNFVIVNNIFVGFLAFTLSWNGIVESILVVFIYSYIRKLISNE